MTRNQSLLLAGCLVSACGSGDDRPGEPGLTAGTDSGLTMATDGASGGGTDSPTDGGSGGSTTGASGNTDGSTGMDCGEAMVTPMAVPPNVVLVLDKSGSMVSNSWDHDGDAGTDPLTRWNSLHNVVSFITTEFDSQLNFGAQLFPSMAARAIASTAACPVQPSPEVAVMAVNGANVVAGIPGATDTSLAGATPAAAGVAAAVAHLKTLDPMVDRVVILVTDGAANCAAAPTELLEDYDANLPIVVGDALSTDDIPTYVIGIDMVNYFIGCKLNPAQTECGQCSDDMAACGNATDCAGAGATCEAVDIQPDGTPLANPWEELNLVAEAGGVPRPGAEKFYNANDEMELQAALAEIAGAVISCTIPLEPAPTDKQKNYVEVEIDGMVRERVTDCATEDGWVYSNLPALDEITLCGAACDAFKGAQGVLDATYGCPPVG